MVDSHWRSLIKAVTWRTLGSLSTAGIAWMICGEIRAAASIGVLDFFAKAAIYYFHERLWNRVSLGRIHPPEYEI